MFTHNRSWGYSAFDNDFKSTNTLIRLLATSASRGGNFMLNMGPDGRGRFPEGAQKRLLAVGAWLKVNGDSIYDDDSFAPAADAVGRGDPEGFAPLPARAGPSGRRRGARPRPDRAGDQGFAAGGRRGLRFRQDASGLAGRPAGRRRAQR
ncbi:alpha-L-fucosidase [Caulobacter segnis]